MFDIYRNKDGILRIEIDADSKIKMKEEFNTLLQRLEKGRRYIDNPNLSPPEKENALELYVKILLDMKTVSEILKLSGEELTEEIYSRGFDVR